MRRRRMGRRVRRRVRRGRSEEAIAETKLKIQRDDGKVVDEVENSIKLRGTGCKMKCTVTKSTELAWKAFCNGISYV